MVQELTTKPNIWGRIGMGLSRGLAETVPKEIERQRLSSGLKQFEQDSASLTPMQQLARLSSIPGITPQMIQSFGELGKQQGFRNSLQSMAGQGEEPSSSAGANQSGFDPRVASAMQKMGIEIPQQQQSIPSGFDNRAMQAREGKSVNKEGPTAEKYLPPEPLNQDQRYALESRLANRFPNANYDEIQKMANDEETRRLQNPKAWQDRYDYITKREQEAEDILGKQLETALQKEGKDVYGDLTGDTLLDLQKAMNNDLATDPSLHPKQAAEKWRLKARDFVTSKNQLKEIANRDLSERLIPSKKVETLKDLSVAQKRYADLGKQREFYDTLISDFGLSPGGAALIAYPRSDGLKSLIRNSNFDDVSFQEQPSYAAKLAKDFLNKKTGNDSLLAFAKSMKDRSQFFDESAFFDYIRENESKLNDDQKKELLTGTSDVFSNWGDLALFPLTGRSVLHD